MHDLPEYRVTVNGENFDIVGNPECRQYGALFFTDARGNIMKIFAPGTWKEVTRIKEAGLVCDHCGRPW